MLMRSPLARDRRKPPGFIRPCQPVLSAKVPVGDGWIHELKHDGFRIVALKDGDDVRLWSRNGRNWAAEMVAIAAAVLALPGARIVLDARVWRTARGEPLNHGEEGRWARPSHSWRSVFREMQLSFARSVALQRL